MCWKRHARKRAKKACCLTQIELTRDAEHDLIDIYLYGIEQFGPAQAERYAIALNTRIACIADNPSVGSDYSTVREGLRRYEHISHAVYYRPTAGGILVLRILHGGMDPGRHIT
jgi:toxin ParE1/3/4